MTSTLLYVVEGLSVMQVIALDKYCAVCVRNSQEFMFITRVAFLAVQDFLVLSKTVICSVDKSTVFTWNKPEPEKTRKAPCYPVTVRFSSLKMHGGAITGQINHQQ